MAFGAGEAAGPASSPHRARFLERGPPAPSNPLNQDLCLGMRSSSCCSCNCGSDFQGSSDIYDAPQNIKLPAELNFFPPQVFSLEATKGALKLEYTAMSISINVYMCKYVYIYICMYIYTYIYMYMYIWWQVDHFYTFGLPR